MRISVSWMFSHPTYTNSSLLFFKNNELTFLFVLWLHRPISHGGLWLVYRFLTELHCSVVVIFSELNHLAVANQSPSYWPIRNKLTNVGVSELDWSKQSCLRPGMWCDGRVCVCVGMFFGETSRMNKFPVDLMS